MSISAVDRTDDPSLTRRSKPSSAGFAPIRACPPPANTHSRQSAAVRPDPRESTANRPPNSWYHRTNSGFWFRLKPRPAASSGQFRLKDAQPVPENYLLTVRPEPTLKSEGIFKAMPKMRSPDHSRDAPKCRVVLARPGSGCAPAGGNRRAVPRIHSRLDERRQSNAEHGQEGPTLLGVVGVGGD